MRLGRLYMAIVMMTLFMTPFDAIAENTEEELHELDEVVVTATRREKRIKDLPSSVTVLSVSDIERADAINVPELIKEIPGVTVNGTAGDGSSLSISIRGVNPSRTNKILVMVNGVPMNNGWSGTTWWRDLPASNQIERIEVIKGPVSTLYGGHGMGGCINIVTKRGSVDPESRLETTFGSDRLMKYSAETGGSVNKTFNYQFGASYKSGDGYRDRSAFEDYGASMKMGWMLSESSDIDMDFGYSKVDNEVAGRLTLEQYEQDPYQAASQYGRRDMERLYSNFTFRHDMGDDNLKAVFYYHTLDYDYVFATSSNKDTMYDTYTTGGEIQYTLNHQIGGKNNTLIFGPTIRYDKADAASYSTIEGSPTGDPTVDSLSKPLFWAFYLQDELSITDPLTLTVGVRYDKAEYDHTDYIDTENSGVLSVDKISPMASIAYRFSEDTSVFGTVGQGFSPPPVADLYSEEKGNPDLKPETAINYEVGIRTSSLGWFGLTASFYVMDVQDEIVTVAINDDESKKINAGETRHKGFETEVDIRLPKNITPFVNYTYQSVKYTDYRTYSRGAYSVYDGNRVPHISEHILIAGIRYKHASGIGGSLSARYDGDKYTDNNNEYRIPSYTVWDARASYEGDIGGMGITTYLSVNNLFDKEYYYKGTSDDVYPAEPRSFSFNAALKF